MATLKVLVNAECCAVKGYSNICDMTAGKDHRTYDPCLAFAGTYRTLCLAPEPEFEGAPIACRKLLTILNVMLRTNTPWREMNQQETA